MKWVFGVIRNRTFLGLVFVLQMSAEAQYNPATLRFSRDILPEHKALIQNDLAYLRRGQFLDPSSEMKRIMKLPLLSGKNLESWLMTRVHFLIGQNHRVDQTAVETVAENIDYADGVVGKNLVRMANPANDYGTLMTNIGAVLYQTGKEMGDLYSFRMDGIGQVVVKSPRSGILKIGGIYFHDIYEDDSMSASSLKFIHSLYRMATLFHEARHSDGHGSSLGFFHSKCPAGHAYANLMACDQPSNGPYRIGAMMIDSALKGCVNCSEGQKDALKILRNDSLTRILSEYQIPKDNLTRNVNSSFCELNVFTDSGCVQKPKEKIEWDDRPEEIEWKK